MHIKGEGSYHISNKDVVSFTFDADYDPDRPVLIDPSAPSRHYTYNTAKKNCLHKAGLKRGDTVCIHSFNSLLYPLLVLAIIGAGGLSVGTNPSYTRHELNHGVKVAKIKMVFAEPEILPNMLSALEENGIDVGIKLFILDTRQGQAVPKEKGMKSWRKLLEHGEEDWIRFDDETKSRDTVAQLYYTSGTTGLPKCAMTTHRNLVAEHQLFFEANPRTYPIKIILCMPFFHVGILPQVLVSAIKQGREAHVMRRFDVEPYMKYHATYNLTETFMVPPMVSAIVMSGFADETSKNYRPEYSMRTVRNGTVGAAPCSGDLQKRFHALLHPEATFGQNSALVSHTGQTPTAEGVRSNISGSNLDVDIEVQDKHPSEVLYLRIDAFSINFRATFTDNQKVWGMTETTSMFGIVPWDVSRKTGKGEMEAAWGNVGRPMPECTMKLCDEEGKDVTQTVGRGELCVKGPAVVKGYFENEKATNDSWDSEGFFKTGDVIRWDSKLQLMFVEERVKELIKVRGFQVAPAELEGVLTAHASIIDAAVIGKKVGEDGTELPKAFVVLRQGHKMTVDDVHAHMKDHVARYKQLTGGVQFVDSIPKLPSGKILKRVLREQEKQGPTAKL